MDDARLMVLQTLLLGVAIGLCLAVLAWAVRESWRRWRTSSRDVRRVAEAYERAELARQEDARARVYAELVRQRDMRKESLEPPVGH